MDGVRTRDDWLNRLIAGCANAVSSKGHQFVKKNHVPSERDAARSSRRRHHVPMRFFVSAAARLWDLGFPVSFMVRNNE